jgi:hypothetical protein
MTEDEIKLGILQICKVKGWDSDINVVGFNALCDNLIELGAVKEREECAKICDGWSKRDDDVGGFIGKSIRARGQE